MATTDIDHEKLQKQLAILMQNSTAFSSVMYKLLVTSEPMDVEVNVFTDENTFETIVVPNRAKGSIPALYGAGTPEEVQAASYGALYIDTNSSNVYIKTSPNGTTGWLLLATEQNIKEHNNNPGAHDGVLAQLHGDSKNYFEVADLVAGDRFDGKYAVNKDSLNMIIGDLSTVNVNNNSNVASALNEVIEINNYEAGCMVSGGVNAVTGAPAGIILEGTILKVVAPFIIVSAKGRKYTITETKAVNMSTKSKGTTYSIYYDLDSNAVVLSTGAYYVGASRPYYMKAEDCWFNISGSPYKFLKLEYVSASNSLELKEKNYVYLGTVEWGG